MPGLNLLGAVDCDVPWWPITAATLTLASTVSQSQEGNICDVQHDVAAAGEASWEISRAPSSSEFGLFRRCCRQNLNAFGFVGAGGEATPAYYETAGAGITYTRVYSDGTTGPCTVTPATKIVSWKLALQFRLTYLPDTDETFIEIQASQGSNVSGTDPGWFSQFGCYRELYLPGVDIAGTYDFDLGGKYQPAMDVPTTNAPIYDFQCCLPEYPDIMQTGNFTLVLA